MGSSMKSLIRDKMTRRSATSITPRWFLSGNRIGLSGVRITAAIALWFGFSALAQVGSATSALPIIEANSLSIKIIDGGDQLDGLIVPELKPDIYAYYPADRSKTVSFVTDVDRIDLTVTPGKTYDFVIRLKDGKLAHQRVAPTAVTYRGKGGSGVDTIPFSLGRDHIIHVKGKLNGSDELDLHFDTGSFIGVISGGGVEKGAKVYPNSANRFEINGITIDRSRVIVIDPSGKKNKARMVSLATIRFWGGSLKLIMGLGSFAFGISCRRSRQGFKRKKLSGAVRGCTFPSP
jgi:hypothetical protein